MPVVPNKPPTSLVKRQNRKQRNQRRRSRSRTARRETKRKKKRTTTMILKLKVYRMLILKKHSRGHVRKRPRGFRMIKTNLSMRMLLLLRVRVRRMMGEIGMLIRMLERSALMRRWRRMGRVRPVRTKRRLRGQSRRGLWVERGVSSLVHSCTYAVLDLASGVQCADRTADVHCAE
jgi:hypothetical protein